jgi:hypothetical protein
VQEWEKGVQFNRELFVGCGEQHTSSDPADLSDERALTFAISGVLDHGVADTSFEKVISDWDMPEVGLQESQTGELLGKPTRVFSGPAYRGDAVLVRVKRLEEIVHRMLAVAGDAKIGDAFVWLGPTFAHENVKDPPARGKREVVLQSIERP